MRRNRLSYDFDDANINLTPLIDVVFVVLIMFILIAPLLNADRVQLANGKPHNQDISQGKSVTIHVFADNSLQLNQFPISLEELPARLSQLKYQSPNERIILFHDKKAFFGTYQEVKSAAELAGFEQMDVVLDPKG